jgi:hypothetical protein
MNKKGKQQQQQQQKQKRHLKTTFVNGLYTSKKGGD